MKKILRALLFSLLASASLCACGGDSEEVPSLPPTPKPEVKQTEVKLASIITQQSRGTDLNQQEILIANGQQVGLPLPEQKKLTTTWLGKSEQAEH